MLLRDEDTIDVGYTQQVVEFDITTYHVIHDNHLLNLTLHNIANCVLFPHPLNAMFVEILCFCQLVKIFN